ncbi:receptor-like protein EIX1 [Humulus lupulus]|uniref:receptor-like protein EIX1 n=1 Tax=Humulus lupulus TaxID=3486 RepID=UPI002B40845C|nr:receptor-like protein EIX1 [Humulus lupulus]
MPAISSASMDHVTIIIFLVLFAVVTMMVNVCLGNGESIVLCSEIEKQALLSIKRDLVDHDNKLVSWNVSEEEDCCKWAGISCNTQTGHVYELSLKDRSLTDGDRQ